MHELMWNARTGRWHDLFVPSLADHAPAHDDRTCCQMGVPAEEASTCEGANAVSWLPFLWGMPGAACREDVAGAHRTPSAIVANMQHSGLIEANGLLNTTAVRSGEQWDAPNCWPPLLCMWVDGLLAHGGASGAKLAPQLAQAYLRAVRRSLQVHGVVYEKYATDGDGDSGHGGEYAPQVGFGWSNGVALHLLCTL
jgi:alpha,alpha-trehalase